LLARSAEWIDIISSIIQEKFVQTMPRKKNPFSMEYILLGFVAQGPIHGYDLHKKIGDRQGIGLIWRIKQSHLYALLDNLEKEGLLVSRTLSGDAFQARKEFQITAMGRRNFEAWLTSPVQHGRDMRQEFLAKLFFILDDNSGLKKNLIQEQISVCSEWIVKLKEDNSKQANHFPYAHLIMKYRISQIQAMLDWLNELE
jgi:PadR family transcriptional regulator AphA